jgi:hypothetical protein
VCGGWAPDIVEAILDGRQPTEMTLAALMQPFAVGWTKQQKTNFVKESDFRPSLTVRAHPAGAP